MKKVFCGLIISILSTTVAFSQGVSVMLEQALGSVVTVGVTKTQKYTIPRGYRGDMKIPDMAYQKALDLYGVQEVGSGFIILKNYKKYIITNAHVVGTASDEPGSIYIYSISRKKYEARVIGGDSFYDIAVLEFVAPPGPEITAVEFKKEDARIGEPVYAIGNPLGEFPYSVVDGIISAKHRVREGTTGKFGYLQTTATLIWGNSGGPLVDAAGKVIGVNSQLYFTNFMGTETPVIQPQINFALEAPLAERLVNDIILNNGQVTRAFLGVEVSQRKFYDPENSYEADPGSTDDAPIVSGVIEGSPAYIPCRAYIGTRLVKINGVAVQTIDDVQAELENIKPNTTVTLELMTVDHAMKSISFLSKKLNEPELKKIGEYVLHKDERVVIDENSPVVTFSMRGSNYYQYQEKNYKQTIPANSYSPKFIVIGAGLVDKNTKLIWKVEDFKDLGAAVRLSGINGVIDFAVVPANSTGDDPQMCRMYLSNDQNINKQTLWY